MSRSEPMRAAETPLLAGVPRHARRAPPFSRRRRMDVNRNKPDRWKQDIARSVDMYNEWFLQFAPAAYRDTRIRTTSEVQATLTATRYLTDISVAVLKSKPAILPTLRMSACPPLAVDRLVGLSGVSKTLVNSMERKHRLPPRMPNEQVDDQLGKIGETIKKMADPDIFVWLGRGKKPPSTLERYRAATIVADRLCGAVANPIIRNAQEKRQLTAIGGVARRQGIQARARRNHVRPHAPPAPTPFG